MFLSSPYLEPFCHAGLFLGLGYGLEYFLGLLMYTINFDFVSKALYFLFSYHLHLGPFCSFWSLLVYVWVGVRFKNFFRAYSHRLPILFLEVKCYLFVITSAPFGAFFAFLGPHWTIHEVWIRLKKKNSGPTHIDYYHWFLK